MSMIRPALAALATLLAGTSAAEAQFYKVTATGLQGGFSTINDKGLVGAGSAGGNAAFWSAETGIVEFGKIGVSSRFRHVNNNGVAVGYYVDSNLNNRALAWTADNGWRSAGDCWARGDRPPAPIRRSSRSSPTPDARLAIPAPPSR